MLDAKGIALVVDEPAPRRFYWVLQSPDLASGSQVAVEAARAPMPSYGLAMMAGLSALERLRGLCFFTARVPSPPEFSESRVDFGATTVQSSLQ